MSEYVAKCAALDIFGAKIPHDPSLKCQATFSLASCSASVSKLCPAAIFCQYFWIACPCSTYTVKVYMLDFVITHPQILLNLPLNFCSCRDCPWSHPSANWCNHIPTIPPTRLWISEPMGGPKSRPLVGHWLFPYEFFLFLYSLFPWTKMFAKIWIQLYFQLPPIIRILPDNRF